MLIWKSIKPFIFHFILIRIKEKKSDWYPGPFPVVSLLHLQGQRVKDGGRSELGKGLKEGIIEKLSFFYKSRKTPLHFLQK